MKFAIFSLFVVACVLAVCLASGGHGPVSSYCPRKGDAGHGAHDAHGASDSHAPAAGGHGDGHGDAHANAGHGSSGSDKCTTFGVLAVLVPLLFSVVLSK